VGADLRNTARQILESEKLPGSANNDTNPNRGDFELVVWDELDLDDAWWILGQDPGLTIVDSGMPVITSYFDEASRSVVMQAKMMFGAAVDDWRKALLANAAAS